MNKTSLKHGLGLLLCVALTVVLCACGSGTKEETNTFRTPEVFKDISKRTGIHMDVVLEEEDKAIELYRKKNDLYVNYEDEETSMILITDGKIVTVLDPQTKTGEQAEVDESIQEELDTIEKSVGNIYKIAKADADWKKGVVKHNGMEYESEEVENEKQKTQFLYNDDGELVYIIAETDDETSAMEIKEIDNKVPDDIFEVPDNYTIGGGQDTSPEPQTDIDDGKSDKKQTTRVPTPSGKEVTFTNHDHGYQFSVDSAYDTEIDDYSMKVYTYKSGQVPFFSLSLMQNRSGQSDEELLEGVAANIIKREGDKLVKGPISNTVQAGSRKVKGIEWIYKSEDGTKEYVGVQYTELIGTFFYSWTAVYEKGDTVTPAALERAISTFEMLAT